jgi:signal transduction histidine kinase
LNYAGAYSIMREPREDDVLSRMSHELRSPLGAITGFGKLLESGELDEHERRYAAMILKASQRLLSMVDEVLDISRVEEGTRPARVSVE